jgi:very-short-patch-repair endonuclease
VRSGTQRIGRYSSKTALAQLHQIESPSPVLPGVSGYDTLARPAIWCRLPEVRQYCPCTAPVQAGEIQMGTDHHPSTAGCIHPVAVDMEKQSNTNLISALARRGGAATASQLMKAGLTKAELATGVVANTVARPARGLYVLPGASADLVLARRCRALLTCISAATYYHLWLLHPPEKPHLCAAHRRLPDTIADHRWPLAEAAGVLPYAPLKDVLLHALRCRPRLEALVLVESAVNRGEMTIEFLQRRLPGNRNAPLRSIVDQVEPGADSLVETLARVLFRSAGLEVETQVRLEGIGYVDFLLEGFLVIEIDGMTHLEKSQFKKDRRRDNRALMDGYLVMRYFYEDVVFRSEQMLAEIRGVLSGRVII